MKPDMQVAEIQQSCIICASGWDFIGPGKPNQPAGARRSSDWDDDWSEELDEYE